MVTLSITLALANHLVQKGYKRISELEFAAAKSYNAMQKCNERASFKETYDITRQHLRDCSDALFDLERELKTNTTGKLIISVELYSLAAEMGLL